MKGTLAIKFLDCLLKPGCNVSGFLTFLQDCCRFLRYVFNLHQKPVFSSIFDSRVSCFLNYIKSGLKPREIILQYFSLGTSAQKP